MCGVDLEFEIFFLDEKVGEVKILDSKLVYNTVINSSVFMHPFPNSFTYMSVVDGLEDRVFPYERENRDVLISLLGLEEYNVFEILKKTHGISTDDPIWFKFSFDDANLTFKDVYII